MKLSNSQLIKLKSELQKKDNQANLNLSSSIIGDDETNFLYKLLLTNTQVSKI